MAATIGALKLQRSATPTWLLACLILVAAAAVHFIAFVHFRAGEIILFVGAWYERLTTEGFAAFATPFSNYTPTYLYLLWLASLVAGAASAVTVVKLLAIGGALWLSFALFRLFKALGVERPVLPALASLLLPSVLFNTSMLGQADTFWVAPSVLAVLAAIERRFAWTAFWSGLAFAIKAQAIFLAPFVLWIFLSNRVPLKFWLIPPLVYIGAMMPAWLAGWDWWYLVNVYFRQAQWQPQDRLFISNSASWWTLFGHYAPAAAIRLFPLGYLLAALGTAFYLRTRIPSSPRMLLIMAILSASGLPFLLPGMHDRFFILADILAFALAVVTRERRAVVAAILIQIASAMPVVTWAYQFHRAEIAAPFLLVGGMMILIEMLREKAPGVPAEPLPNAA